ncbi:MAG: N-acetylmuramoyl-L-alanine amidase [Chloroflexota bacterium]|nr:N-acetylmuramoyl-L-alanine amidase [Chloroflexota bacterium]
MTNSSFLYGIHDPGGEPHMLDRGVPGWVLITVAIGHNPGEQSPGDDTRFWGNYNQLSDRGLGVIVRLNNGYAPSGTLPHERDYDGFAQRCANFVRNSQGANIWIIGNEPNHPIEWPGADWDWNAVPPRPKNEHTAGEKITPQRYAACYRKARASIRSVSGHEQDQVLVAGAAPWNTLTTYAGNESGDWVQYFSEILQLVSTTGCDGISLHAYTHGIHPSLITSDARVGDARYNSYHWHFRCYRDFMRVIPDRLRRVPVYITETDQGDDPWHNENSGWVREAYKEIDRWNQAGNQQIRSLILYRWPRVGNDRWWIEGKQGVIEDWQQALEHRYQWQESPGLDLAELRRQVEELAAAVAVLEPAVLDFRDLALQASELEREVIALTDQASEATSLRQEVSRLTREVSRLETTVQTLVAGDVPRPAMTDLRASLATHPTAQYPTRPLDDIRQIIIHHTATRSNIPPEQVAQFQVSQGFAGIKYHYQINGDGTIVWTQSLDTVTEQTANGELNRLGIAVALAGNFNNRTPSTQQMDSAAQLLAWLLAGFRLTSDAIVGRSEVDSSDPSGSPGRQWLEGDRFGEQLLSQVETILAGAEQELVARLQARISQLESLIVELQAQAGQVEPLQQEVQALRLQVDQQQAQISQLAGEKDALSAENARLWTTIQNMQGGAIAQPSTVDLVDALPRHPSLPPYERRTHPISRVVIHHTDTPLNFTVEQIAHYHVYGQRWDQNGNLVKAQWPGIGYHYVITPDGTIHQSQRPETRSYHAGNANNDSVGVSLIGRFLRRNWGGTPIPVELQLPTAEQMGSASHLAAWLMQENNITAIDRIVGHKEVSDTTCPGDQWLRGATWKQILHAQIQAVTQGVSRYIEYTLLFWDHGLSWAEADWRGAQNYIAHFRPTVSFSTAHAFSARHVVIIGGDAGVSGDDEARLRAAGVDVHRLAGADEAETTAMLDALVEANTPWPGAPPDRSRLESLLTSVLPPPRVPEDGEPDRWTVPDDYQPGQQELEDARSPVPPHRIKVESLYPPGFAGQG